MKKSDMIPPRDYNSLVTNAKEIEINKMADNGGPCM
jgi:hypothetical protein